MNGNTSRAIAEFLRQSPAAAEFLKSVGLSAPARNCSVEAWLAQIPDEALLDAGLERGHILTHLEQLLAEASRDRAGRIESVGSLRIVGGRDKDGREESVSLDVLAGEVVCIVGPTGSGKSRLLSDIECLAQGDTPTARRILIDGRAPTDDERWALERRLVVELSQNTSFVVDLTVNEFIEMHAQCRFRADAKDAVRRVIDCANRLTGEMFRSDTSLTQLSGGQTRALMIADAALLAFSPIILIDEIENAGVDRRKAIELLIQGQKIVFISTHDPLLALRGTRRIVIRNGGIAEVLTTSDRERENLKQLERMDRTISTVREQLRHGERIEREILSEP
jgi:ABC-type lipoprotein export system ATPase subunit